MKSSHCPKYERKNLKNSVLSIQDKNFQIFRSYFGQCDDFILSFWNLLTFSHVPNELGCAWKLKTWGDSWIKIWGVPNIILGYGVSRFEIRKYIKCLMAWSCFYHGNNPSFIHSCSISYILKYEFFCFGCLSRSVQ